MNGELLDHDADADYAWCIKFLTETEKQSKVSTCDSKKHYFGEPAYQDPDGDYASFTKLIQTDEQIKFTGFENQNENENVYEYEYENGDKDEGENDKDPRYCMFMKNLKYHDISYKQKAKRRLNKKKGAISTKKEVSRRKKINDTRKTHCSMNVDSCYQTFLNLCIPCEQVAVKSEEDLVEYEKNVTACDLDSDVVILDVPTCSKVNSKQPLLTEKEPSLREKLMRILKQPYDEKEHEELSHNIQQKKPMGRHLDLRGRPMSSAFGGVEKSLLDIGPGSFRHMLVAAQNDPHKALNLLRMFFFWLEHVPNEDVFEPWKDKDILNVRPVEKKALQ